MIEYDCHFTCTRVAAPFKWFWIRTYDRERDPSCLTCQYHFKLYSVSFKTSFDGVFWTNTENNWFYVYSRCGNYISLQTWLFGCHWWVVLSHFCAAEPLRFWDSDLFAQYLSSNASFSTWLRQKKKVIPSSVSCQSFKSCKIISVCTRTNGNYLPIVSFG